MWRVECKEAMLSWVQSEWETHASHHIYDVSSSDGAFNVPIDALPLQIGVLVTIAILFTFSLSFLISAIYLFCAFANFPFKGASEDS